MSEDRIIPAAEAFEEIARRLREIEQERAAPPPAVEPAQLPADCEASDALDADCYGLYGMVP